MVSFFYIVSIILGLITGSFLNCVVYRLEKKESFLKGRSHCFSCHKKLIFFDLIPVLSFFVLKGKCRYCSAKISWQYPLVEISTALTFFAVFNYQSLIFNGLSLSVFLSTFYYWIITSIFIVVFVYDLKHFIIPDEAVITLISVSFVWYLINFLSGYYSFQLLFVYFLSGLGAFLFFLFFYLVSQGKWMGFGDVKLVFAIGFFLGFPETIIALSLSFLIGALVGIVVIAFKKKNIKSEIPFAPFLVAGTFSTFFWSETILTHYFMFLRIH